MAYFRQIHVSSWKDPWFFDLEPDEKLLFIYLFSNENTSISGIYEIPFRVICFETGLDTEFVNTTLDKFEKAKKVYFENGVIWVKNMRKYNASTSEKVMKGIENDLAKIPECPIKQLYIAYYSPDIPYTEGIDTISLQDNTIRVQNTIPEEELNGASADIEPPEPVKKVSKKKTRDPLLDHPAIIAYKDEARLHVPITWRKQVCDTVDDAVMWKELVHSWIGKGWNKQNIEGMLQAYVNGGIDKQKEEPAGFSAIRSYRKKAGLDNG
jgi:hypothetical protein